jgi:hypothetical protein
VTSSRRRRAVGSVLALAIGLGVAATGCGGNDEPGTPAISGENPGEVTVPTSPPTTATTIPGEATTTTTAPPA